MSLDERKPYLGAQDVVLRACVALPALTAAWLAWTNVSSVNSWLLMGVETSAAFADGVERVAAVGLTIAALSLFARPGRVACLLIAGWFLMLSLATFQQGGAPFAYLAPASHSVRYVAPLALLLLHRGKADMGFTFLRAAIATTFVAHGYEALQHHPEFIDLIIPSARRHLGMSLMESEARGLLTAIGWLDIVVAVALCVRRWRFVAAYLVFWGTVTLASRMLAWGFERWPESFLRLANGGAPLALLFFWRPYSCSSSDERTKS